MKAPQLPYRTPPFNLTPLIDVVFNLVIFFLVISHFSRSESTYPVDLPGASVSVSDPDPRRLTVTIRKEGGYLVGDNPVSLDDIERMIAEEAGSDPRSYAVRIRGDRQAPYGIIEPIMLACAKYGVTTFGFHVIPQSE